MDSQVCPECALSETTIGSKFVDSNGIELKVGSAILKSRTKVKNIKLLDGPVNGHDISCKVEGLGQIYLKCSVVKKA